MQQNKVTAKKRIPERKCLGCGESKPKAELARVVRAPDGSVSLDLIGRKPGRGAYVCRNTECLKKCRKQRRIERSLEVEIPDEVWDALEGEMSRYE